MTQEQLQMTKLKYVARNERYPLLYCKCSVCRGVRWIILYPVIFLFTLIIVGIVKYHL